jgi:hypothetical protein
VLEANCQRTKLHTHRVDTSIVSFGVQILGQIDNMSMVLGTIWWESIDIVEKFDFIAAYNRL